MVFLPNLILDNALGHVFNTVKAAYAVTPLSLRWAEVLTATLLPAASLLIVEPLEMARIRLAGDKTTGEAKKYKGILDALDSIVRKEGFKGIYKTFIISLAGVLIFKFYCKALNDKLLSYLVDPDELARFGVAAASSVIAGLFTYPLDTIRARLAMEAGEKDAKFEGVWDAAKKIFTEEELKSFYAGA
jgi:solute carrier family 25 (adenine nucleotide translocator) protein 4/5/6/31